MTEIQTITVVDSPEHRTPWHIHVPTGGKWTDTSLETASWYDTYEIVPGTYPVLFTTIGGTVVEHPEWRNAYIDALVRRRDKFPVDHPTHQWCQHRLNITGRPYYAVARVDAILRHSHRVNRLWTEHAYASSAQDTHPDTRTTVFVQIYSYNAEPGYGVLYDDTRTPLGTITKEA